MGLHNNSDTECKCDTLGDLVKTVKTNHGEVLLLLKVTFLHGCFSCPLVCTNTTKFIIEPNDHTCI